MLPPLMRSSELVDVTVGRIVHETAVLSILTRERWLLDYRLREVLNWAVREIQGCLVRDDGGVPPDNPFPPLSPPPE